MKLTPEQQKQVESLTTSAAKVASKLCPGDDEARSIAFLALCEAVTRYQPRTATLKTFCLRWVRGELRDYKRRTYHLRKKNRPVFLTLPANVPGQFDGFAQVEIDDLLSVLRPCDREIFSRKVFENVPVASLAKERGCSVQTIYNILKRCKARLRREIDGQHRSDTSGRM